jgi:hypothetical protein
VDLTNTTFTTVPGVCGGFPNTPLYENKGTVTGQTAGGQVVQDVDPSHYCNPPGELLCPQGDPTGDPVGILSFQVLGNGDVQVSYLQSLNVNDNSYGANAIGWGSKKRGFSSLTGSDEAEFKFTDKNGKVVLDFKLDYLTCLTTIATPSQCKSLGATGGDGTLITGSAANILSFDTTLAQNLNTHGFCSGGSCIVNGVNLKIDSPPADANFNVIDPIFTPWNFVNGYFMTISHLAFGAAGFGNVQLASIHNSPAKRDIGIPEPCVPGGGGQQFCTGGIKPQKLEMKYTGDKCTATHDEQDVGKVSCTDNVASPLPATVRIVASEKAGGLGKIWFNGIVNLNGTFFIDATNAGATTLAADTFVLIKDAVTGAVLQTIKFHTSCSQPLNEGDQFGSLELVGFVGVKKK